MKLPVIPIAAPCPEDWSAMAGDAHTRHCDRCQTPVVDLSSLTTPEAHQALTGSNRPACVRYLPAADGTIITRTDQQQRFLALLLALSTRNPSGT